MSKDQVEKTVDSLIKELNLQECENTMVGGTFLPKISGGERKRTSLGYEMITDPRLVFLDEPTSGLDSANAMSIIKLLKKETQLRGCSIMCSLHQPSTQLFKMFDRVICLSEGEVIYNGPVAEVKPYFELNFGL